MSFIDDTFLPVAIELIDGVFPTKIKYFRNTGPSYDPATGEVTPNTVEYAISAGILSSGRTAEGGIAESQEARLWIHHGAGGFPFLPTTSDVIEYSGFRWKVSSIDPTYSSDGLIASRITARAQ